MPTDIEILDSAPVAEGADATAVAAREAAQTPAAEAEAAAPAPEAVGAQPPAAGDTAAQELEYPDEAPEESEGDKPEQAPEAAGGAEAGAEGRYGTSALTRLLKDNPALAEAAKSNPRAQAQLYAMARRSQDLAAYQEIAPSLSQLKEAVEAREALGSLDEGFYKGEPEGFWSKLYDASGQSGAYERHVQFLHKIFLDSLGQSAQAAGNEALSSAVKTIREALAPHSQASDGGRGGTTGDERLPVHIRQQLQELEQLRSRRSQDEQQAAEHFMDETGGEAAAAIRSFVEGILAKSAMSDYEKASIARDFIEAVVQLADRDKVHNAALLETIQQGGYTPETRAKLVAQAKAWVRQNGREILEPIMKRAGAGLRLAAAARPGERAEPRSSAGPAGLAAPSGRELVQTAEKKLGRRLTDREILDLPDRSN